MKLLREPQIEADGFTIDYKTKRDWVVTTTGGEEIMFKKYTGKCKGFNMGYQEPLELLQSVSKLDTVKGNYEGFTKKDVGKAI